MVKCEVTLDREERSFKTLNIIGLNRVTKSVPEVRIHLPPPASLKCREILRSCPRSMRKRPDFRGILTQTGPEK